MNTPQYILCIETGTDTCSVALCASRTGEEGRGTEVSIVGLRESHGERDHAARLAVYVAEVLDEAGVKASELAAVAVSKGPGSYTGLRIGVSMAKGLAYGLGIPLIGVGSPDSLCQISMLDGGKNNPPPAFRLPMIDARRMEVYGQVFDGNGKPLTGPEAIVVDRDSFDEWRRRGEVWIFGNGAAKCRQTLPWAHYAEVKPSARGMARLAAEALEAGRKEDVAYFEPFYLKDFVATTPKKRL